MSALPETMKAAVWEGQPYHVAIREVPRPKLQDETDVIVKISTAAICGTDLHIYHGITGGDNPPWNLGHEAVGDVVEKGSKVQNLEIGDHVVIPDFVVEPELAAYGFNFSSDFATTTYLGGLQAEYARVPLAASNTIKLPNKTNDANWVLLSDIFVTAWGSLTGSGFQAGDTVAVYGAGPVGTLAAYSALLRGASRVYSIDHVESRLEKAKAIGAIPIDLKKGDPAEQILKLEPAGVMRVLDCVGFECVNEKLEPQENFVINNSIHLVASTGGIYITGVYAASKPTAGEPNASLRMGHIRFNVAEWWAKNVTINGGGVYPEPIWNTLFNLIKSGRADPAAVVDKIVTIDQVPEAYRAFSDHKVGKTLIRFSSAEIGAQSES